LVRHSSRRGILFGFDRNCGQIAQSKCELRLFDIALSERAPYDARFSVSSIARSFSFSARNMAIVSSRMSGSRGNEEMPDDMHRFYPTDSGCRQVRHVIN
jgi:hypothetical protein